MVPQDVMFTWGEGAGRAGELHPLRIKITVGIIYASRDKNPQQVTYETEAALCESTECVSGTLMQSGESSHISPRAAWSWVERAHTWLWWIQKGFPCDTSDLRQKVPLPSQWLNGSRASTLL